MKRYWYKTYVQDVLSKERMQMPDWLFHRLSEFEAIAADHGEDGLLPPVKDMAWSLRPLSETKLSEALVALSEVGEAEETSSGWRLTHFENRQQSESYERVKRFREKRNAMKQSETVVTDEAFLSSSSSNSSSGSGSVEGGGVGEGEVFAAYEQNVGALTPKIADALKADIEDYSVSWVLAAIDYAVRQEKRSLAYVEGTLKGWRRDGLSAPPKAGEKVNAARRKDDGWLASKEQELSHGRA